MNEPNVVETLREIRFLEGFNDTEVRRLAAVAGLESHPAGHVLFRAGQSLARTFLVASGSIALELPVPGHGSKRVLTVGAGELLGWSPLFGSLPMTATARTMAPTTVVALDARQVLGLCHHDTGFGFVFMQRTAQALAQRLNATRLQMLDLYQNELPVVACVHGGTAT